MSAQREHPTRRELLGSAAGVALGALSFPITGRGAATQPAAAGPPSHVALTAGGNRADNVTHALRLIEKQVRKGLERAKRVIVKPNVVVVNRQLTATHADCLEAIVSFLTTLRKDEIIITDSPASGRAEEGYANYGYTRLVGHYNVKFLDLDEEPTVTRYVMDQNLRPHAVRLARILLDPETYVVSAAVMKTHDRAVVTLSLKNIVLGAAQKDRTYHWGPGSKGTNDKWLVHGGPNNEAIHYNIFQLARELRPDLAVIDGFQAMEGNGPIVGTPVDHKVALASTDWLAADRVGVELMGFDFARVGYLSFCAQTGTMGQADLSRIEVLGGRIADHTRRYRPHDNIEQQYKWMSRTAG